MSLLNSNTKTKILDNTFLDFKSIVSMSIIPFSFLNVKDTNSLLIGYRVVASTDYGLEFNIFEDMQSGVKDRCIKFILDNFKEGKELSGQNVWLNFDKTIGSKILEAEEPDSEDMRKIVYKAQLYAFNMIGTSWLIASYVKPKGVENNTVELEKIRLKYLK